MSFARATIAAGGVPIATQYLARTREYSSAVSVDRVASLSCHRRTSGSSRTLRQAPSGLDFPLLGTETNNLCMGWRVQILCVERFYGPEGIRTLDLSVSLGRSDGACR